MRILYRVKSRVVASCFTAVAAFCYFTLFINPLQSDHLQQINTSLQTKNWAALNKIPDKFNLTKVNAKLLKVIDTSRLSPPSPDPAGITYLDYSNQLLISDSEVNEMPLYSNRNLFLLDHEGNLVKTLDTTLFSDEPTGITYNPSNRHLFISDDEATRVWELDPGTDGLYNSPDDVITFIDTRSFGSVDPEGITFNSDYNLLHIVDGAKNRIYSLSPGKNGVFEGIGLELDDEIKSFDASGLGIHDPEGIAWDPTNKLLFVISSKTEIAQLTVDGQFVRSVDISSANAIKPAGLVLAPSSASRKIMSLYVVDRGKDNGPFPDENDGKIYEFEIPLLGVVVAELHSQSDAKLRE